MPKEKFILALTTQENRLSLKILPKIYSNITYSYLWYSPLSSEFVTKIMHFVYHWN